MKILIVSSFLPYPLFSGGNIRLFNIIKLLSKSHTITLICEKRSQQTAADIAEVKKYCRDVITVDRKKQWSFINIVKTGFSFYPFLLVGHMHKEMKKEISLLLKKESFDVLHVETFYVMHNLPKVQLPTVLVEHNIEYLVYQRFTRYASFFLRPFLFLDVLKLWYWEKYYWNKATKVVAVSEKEKEIMKKSDSSVVPNGVDTKWFTMQNSKLKFANKEKKILFIGDFRWVQNKDAVIWILEEILPKIGTNVKLWIVGKTIPDNIKKMKVYENVLFDEKAPEDTREIFQKADVLLAPIRIGGGTSFKILEAMASGTPVVTTSLGIEGIAAKNGENVLIGDTAEALASHVKEIVSNNNLYEKIAKNARMLIEEKYSWELIVKKLEHAYQAALASHTNG